MWAKIHGKLEAPARDGACYFLRAIEEDPSGSIATEWGIACRYEENAARAAFKRDWATAAKCAWLAVEGANCAEAYFGLGGWAERRIRNYLGPNVTLATGLFATANLLSEELGSAMPGWPLIAVFGEQLGVLKAQISELEGLYDTLCARDFELFEAVASSGGFENRPKKVLDKVLEFGHEVHAAIGFSMDCLGVFVGLGVNTFDAVQNASRFCRKSGIDWKRILDMAEALKFRRVWGGGEDSSEEAEPVKKVSSGDEASHAPAGPAAEMATVAAPFADKPNRKNNGGRKNGRGNGYSEDDEKRVPARAARRAAKQNCGRRWSDVS